MGIRLLAVIHAKQFLRRSSWVIPGDVPKSYCGVYVGDQSQKKRFVIPISYLKDPELRDLLSQAQEEFGYNHANGGLNIPCSEHIFINLTSRLNG
nr:auxin-induced protein 15A-like [Ziziphus jujuba var. spinosa]